MTNVYQSKGMLVLYTCSYIVGLWMQIFSVQNATSYVHHFISVLLQMRMYKKEESTL